MILESKAELAGRVKLQISGGERGTIDYPWQDNMILDQGLIYFLTDNSNTDSGLSRAAVGASSEPVVATQTQLLARIADTSLSITHGWDSAGEFGWSRGVGSFARGAAAGNISELSTGTSATFACARALVRDVEGNPATITVLEDEVLTITWEFRRWWTVAPSHVIDYTIDGVPHSTTVSYMPLSKIPKGKDALGSAGVNGWSGVLIGGFTAEHTITYSESSGNPQISSVSTPQINNGFPAFPTVANYATFTPPIPKTNEFTCAIVLRLTLARRNP